LIEPGVSLAEAAGSLASALSEGEGVVGANDAALAEGAGVVEGAAEMELMEDGRSVVAEADAEAAAARPAAPRRVWLVGLVLLGAVAASAAGFFDRVRIWLGCLLQAPAGCGQRSMPM